MLLLKMHSWKNKEVERVQGCFKGENQVFFYESRIFILLFYSSHLQVPLSKCLLAGLISSHNSPCLQKKHRR
jgi:hypothetical protein